MKAEKEEEEKSLIWQISLTYDQSDLLDLEKKITSRLRKSARKERKEEQEVEEEVENEEQKKGSKKEPVC